MLGLKALKKHYDALGSFLHIQSLKATRSGKDFDYKNIRERCELIAKYVSDALSSPVFNCTIGKFSSIECMECGNPVRKRIPAEKNTVDVECFECGTAYTVIDEGDGKTEWKPHWHEVDCANKNCEKKSVVWRHELELGRRWVCSGCNGENTFVLAVAFKELHIEPVGSDQ